MRHIDMDNWTRRAHFETFHAMDAPHFNLCANVDITLLRFALKQRNVSFTIGMMYLIAKTANRIPEFRYRIRESKIVEYEVVHPSTTILVENELFSYCSVEYTPDLGAFANKAAERIAEVRQNPELDDGDWRDSLLFMTSIPWVSFTGIMHPIHLSPVDTVPRFAWGKFFQEGDKLKMPLSVQAHHALLDGFHVGKFYNQFEAYLANPEFAFG